MQQYGNITALNKFNTIAVNSQMIFTAFLQKKYFIYFFIFEGRIRAVFFMRLDKFLKVSRILKRRTVANEACQDGKVSLNGRIAKPGAQIKAGDKVAITFAGGQLVFLINEIKETVKKDEAINMYTIIEDGTDNA